MKIKNWEVVEGQLPFFNRTFTKGRISVNMDTY